MVEVLLAVLLVLATAQCGEPPVHLDLPTRTGDEVVVDLAGVLDGRREDVAAALREVRGDLDVVALTFESPDASLGLADRAGKKLLDEWDADVVLVAVARPGHFASTEPASRRRFFGIVPAHRDVVPGDVRERIVEEVVPDVAAENDWPAVFVEAAAALRESLAAGSRADTLGWVS